MILSSNMQLMLFLILKTQVFMYLVFLSSHDSLASKKWSHTVSMRMLCSPKLLGVYILNSIIKEFLFYNLISCTLIRSIFWFYRFEQQQIVIDYSCFSFNFYSLVELWFDMFSFLLELDILFIYLFFISGQIYFTK